MDVDLHPDIAPLAFLLGHWVGEGAGEYPGITPFEYGEEIHFWHVGKPFLAYAQRTWALDDGRPMHAETGYWRLTGGSRVELVLAHPTGVAEVEEGSLDGTTIELATTGISLSASAKDVTALGRTIEVRGSRLDYTLAMAAVGNPLTHHLAARLTRA